MLDVDGEIRNRTIDVVDNDVAEPSSLQLLHRAGQVADELFIENIGNTDLTPRQFAVLEAIKNSNEPSQTQLVTKTGVDRSTLADIVRRLVDRGLVERQRTSRDARAYVVSLSESGLNALNNSMPMVQATNDEIMSAIPVAERETVLRGLRSIIYAIENRKRQ